MFRISEFTNDNLKKYFDEDGLFFPVETIIGIPITFIYINLNRKVSPKGF